MDGGIAGPSGRCWDPRQGPHVVELLPLSLFLSISLFLSPPFLFSAVTGQSSGRAFIMVSGLEEPPSISPLRIRNHEGVERVVRCTTAPQPHHTEPSRPHGPVHWGRSSLVLLFLPHMAHLTVLTTMDPGEYLSSKSTRPRTLKTNSAASL